MSIPAAQNSYAEWWTTPLGQYLLAREQAYFDDAVADVFGFYALQLGQVAQDLLAASRIPLKCRLAPVGEVALRADFHDLPIASNSVDLLLLPHVLEFSTVPHQILREVHRVLMPEGHVVISGFNPRSLWGLRRLFNTQRDAYPWCGRFINLPRLKDWLALLGLEIAAGKMTCYVPPCTQEKWIQRFRFVDPAGDRWWPIAGGVYFLRAIKRVRGMRVIMPKWREQLARKKNLAVVPKRVSEDGDAVAARKSASAR
jgi:SAM-dependent methyltransferase